MTVHFVNNKRKNKTITNLVMAVNKQDKELIDPELDPTSLSFNSAKALSVSNALNKKKIKAFDNLSALEVAYNRIDGKVETFLMYEPSKTNNKDAEKKDCTENIKLEGRKFLPHQGLVEKKARKKFTRNILTRLEVGCEGPLDGLKKLMDDKIKVKVYIRKEHGLRGTVIGYIEAFDKHWNLAITNVTEIWQRRKYYFSENKVQFNNTISSEAAKSKLLCMGIVLPKITKKSLNRKYVECMRHVPQLLIRGEQIILVTRDT